MKKYPIQIIAITLCAIGLVNACHKERRQPENVQYYKQGEMLLPSYACPDTLIVMDAAGLNKGMALVEQGFIDATDYEIDSILHTHCVIK